MFRKGYEEEELAYFLLIISCLPDIFQHTHRLLETGFCAFRSHERILLLMNLHSFPVNVYPPSFKITFVAMKITVCIRFIIERNLRCPPDEFLQLYYALTHLMLGKQLL